MTATAMTSTVTQDYLKFLNKFTPLSLQAENAILDKIEIFKGKKGDFLVGESDRCEHFYYIHTGAAHLYFHRGDKRATTWICLDNDIITSIESVANPDDSVKRIIELLEDSVVVKIKLKDINRLYDQHRDIERLGRILTTHYFTVMNQKMNRNSFLTAKERYDRLLADHPETAFRIPLGVIANYLGINQATLSRIRRPDYQSARNN